MLVLILTMNGCMKYSFKGALPSYLKTIYIPMFYDEAPSNPIPESTELLSQKVFDVFIEDNTLKIVDKEKDADLVMTGSITSIKSANERVGENETVTQKKLTVRVSVECMNTHTNKPLWKQTVSESGYYEYESGDIQQAYLDAIELLAEEILTKTIAAW